MNDQIGYDPGSFYIWQASERFAIHLSLKLVSQLSAQITRAARDNQLNDVRGILLGRTVYNPARATVIEDLKLLPSREGEGPEAFAPDSEDSLFEIACRMSEPGNQLHPVGFFRVHPDGDLRMGPHDHETFHRLFSETGDIALLIQTPKHGGETHAALFYWEQGGAQPRDFGFGFPLDASQLSDRHPGWRFPNPFDQTQPGEPARPKIPAAKEPRVSAPALRSKERIHWSRLLLTAAFVVFAIVALQLATNSDRTLAAQRATEPSADAPSSLSLGLTVASRPHQLEIRWNRQSEFIAAADQGVMRITDAGVTEALSFDPPQLRDGYVAYTPKTNDISIRLEVTGKDGAARSESVRAVAIP